MNTCEKCERTFTPTRNSKGRFCSKNCASSFARMRKEVSCPECETRFEQKSTKQKFCSHSCAAVNSNRVSAKRKPEGTCAECERPNTARSGRKYCPECWAEKNAHMGERWDESKGRYVYEPKKDLCECGKFKSFASKRCIECHLVYLKTDHTPRSPRKTDTYQDWIDGVWSGSEGGGKLSRRLRAFLLIEAKYRCQSPTCPVPGGFGGMVNPVTGNVPLEIDHIDGDCHNNTPGNLIVLCPTCHALTPTYRALNKNSKRSSRRKAGNLTQP